MKLQNRGSENGKEDLTGIVSANKPTPPGRSSHRGAWGHGCRGEKKLEIAI